MVFTLITMRTPNAESSQEYKDIFQAYSNIQLVNATLYTIIQDGNQSVFEEILKKINGMNNTEFEFFRVCLIGMTLSVDDPRYNYERSLFSDYKGIGFNNMKEYLRIERLK